jgi:hypothetical protein
MTGSPMPNRFATPTILLCIKCEADKGGGEQTTRVAMENVKMFGVAPELDVS